MDNLPPLPLPPPPEPRPPIIENDLPTVPHPSPPQPPSPINDRLTNQSIIQTTSSRKEWPDVVDRNINKALDILQDDRDIKNKIEAEIVGIDKQILLVFAIALLGSLFFTFYLIAVDKLQPVTGVLYPIITLILGFMSGYFAGTGRTKGRR